MSSSFNDPLGKVVFSTSERPRPPFPEYEQKIDSQTLRNKEQRGRTMSKSLWESCPRLLVGLSPHLDRIFIHAPLSCLIVYFSQISLACLNLSWTARITPNENFH